MNNPLISVVVPEYRGARMVKDLVARISEGCRAISEDFEIILVNDASPDDAWAQICLACESDPRVKGLNLSRNFGQPYAIAAGMAYTRGQWVVVMDCDLQDNPDYIKPMYEKALEGWDMVVARRIGKQFGWFRKKSSSLFNRIFSRMSGLKTDPAIGNYGIYSRKVVDEYNRMKEYSRGFQPLVEYLGFRKTSIDVKHSKRAEGKSSYTLRKLMKLSSDIIISNSNKPLKVAVYLGFVMAIISFVLALYNVIAKLVGAISLPGYTSTVFSIWFVGGILLCVLGVLGLYIGRIFDQVKGRQLFIVMDKVNIDE